MRPIDVLNRRAHSQSLRKSLNPTFKGSMP
jgi:hypothetical protein